MGAGKILAALGVLPVLELVKLVPLLEPSDQVRVWLTLQEYLEPKAHISVDEKIDFDGLPTLNSTSTEELYRVIQESGFELSSGTFSSSSEENLKTLA